ncbi:condensation domain-containing protein [Streptomyces sp. NBC_00386]|uniref:condensation domain-containing protein n=1 Tax=Streptomyces sp. NBC_00386 TaxID=2975734 RepID=UPI002E1D2A76
MSSHHRRPGAVLAVVHEPPGAHDGAPLVLELCGPDRTDAEAIAARVARSHRAYDVELDAPQDGTAKAGRPDRHLLRLTPRSPAAAGAPLTDDLLADLLAPPAAGTVAVSGYRRALLEAALAAPGGPGHFVEQVYWDWTGPLERTRFITAWQSLTEREAVLRASFDWAGAPRLVLHDSAGIEVVEAVRDAHTGAGWDELLRRDRDRGFEPYRPGLLRVSLLDLPPDAGGAGQVPTRLLVTYHRALLDERGARLLVRQFYRSYLAGGTLPGADRRPDIRDHARWLRRQDPAAARELWAAAAPPAGAAVSPARPGGPPCRGGGTGRIQRRLGPPQSARLRSWAVGRGAGESSALHVVWALLLYRAAGTRGPLPVAFGVHVPGRDLPLRAASGIPGLLGDPLPMTVTVDPAAPLADLLLQVRDAALDLTAYAWVCTDQVREWSGRAPGSRLTETTVRFDSHPELPANLRSELAAQGIKVGAPRSAGGATTLPITLVAHHDAEDALVLGALYDRARFTDTEASGVLAQCLQLLRSLPDHPDARFTVGDALRLLGTCAVPVMTVPGAGAAGPAPAVLRAGEPGADLVCLVTVPGVTPGVYDLLLRRYEGPERIVSLTVTGGQVPSAVLGELIGDAGRLTVCGAGPAGRAAHEIARRAARWTRQAPAVVMTGVGGAAESAQALSRALLAVRARSA